jgi:dUTP pyrophosphatase
MIKIKLLGEYAKMPTRATEQSAGWDLYAYDAAFVKFGEIVNISTGVCLEIPEGYVGIIRPRSGLTTKHGVDMCSSGVIDSDYRGVIKVGLTSVRPRDYYVGNGDRIAQIIFVPYLRDNLIEVQELSESERGSGGFGSTGV